VTTTLQVKVLVDVEEVIDRLGVSCGTGGLRQLATQTNTDSNQAGRPFCERHRRKQLEQIPHSALFNQQARNTFTSRCHRAD
jgi:hypothetical protein